MTNARGGAALRIVQFVATCQELEQGPGRALPPYQPINPSTKAIHGFKNISSSRLRKIPPSHRNPNAHLRLIQRPARRLKPKQSVARSAIQAMNPKPIS